MSSISVFKKILFNFSVHATEARYKFTFAVVPGHLGLLHFAVARVKGDPHGPKLIHYNRDMRENPNERLPLRSGREESLDYCDYCWGN